MKAIFLSCNQALFDEVHQVLEKLGVRGYTAVEELIGCGTATGEPHLGTTTWPTMNSALLAIVEDAQCAPLMAALKEIGLYYVLVGLEAVNDKQLKDYNKLSDMRSNIKSVQICNSLGIHLMGMFILDLDFKRRDF